MDFSSSSFTQQDTTDVLQMLIEFHLKQKITIYEQAMTLRATKKLTISSFFLPLPCLPVMAIFVVKFPKKWCKIWLYLAKFQQSEMKLLFLKNKHQADKHKALSEKNASKQKNVLIN